MDLDPAKFYEAVRSRLKNLLDNIPDDPVDQAEWQERLLAEAAEPLDDLHTQVVHLQSVNDALHDENERLRARLAEHRAVETAVEQRAEEFRALAENSPDIIMRFDRDLHHLYVNPAAARLIGIEREAILGRPLTEVDAYEPVLGFLDHFTRPFKTGEEIEMEVAYPGNPPMWFDLRIIPEPGPGEQVETVLVVASNISNHKEIERELAYRAHLLENVHDAIVATDADLCVTSWNRAAEELYGWKAEEILGRPIDEVIPPSSEDQSYAAVFRPLGAGQSLIREVCQATRSGRRIWVESQSMALADEKDQLTGFVSANRDITGRRELEEENERTRAAIAHQKRLLEQQTILLQRQTDLLEAIVANDPGGIAVLSGPDFIFRLVNQAYRDLVPTPDIDPTGRRYDEVWPEQEGFQGSSFFQSVIEEQASVTIERQLRIYPNGEKRCFTLHARPIRWDGQPSMLLIVWERTELDAALEEAHRRTAEAEEGRRMLQALMEYIPEGITISSAVDYKVLYVSKYLAGLGAFQRSQLEGKDLEKYAQLWKAYRTDGVTPVRPEELPMVRSVELGEVIQNEELVLYQPGRQVNLLVNSGPIRDAQGRIFASVVTSRDITERKREEAHQRFLSELGRALVVLRSSDEIMEGIANRVGQYLDLDRCFLSQENPEQDRHEVRFDYHPSMPSVAGVYPQSEHAPRLTERLSQGKTLVIADVTLDPLTSDVYEGLLMPLGIRALISVPIQDRDGKWSGTLMAASRTPRVWRTDEIALLHSVADLAHLALDNARLFHDLQEFRRLFEVALRNAPISVFRTDPDLQVSWIFNRRNSSTASMLEKLPDGTDDAHKLKNPLIALEKKVLDSGRGTHREVTLEQDGNLASYDVTVEPLQDGAGQVVGLTVVMMETTEMRRMEAEAVRNLARIEVQRRLIAERELERTRIARELHDGPLQDLIATNFNLVEAMDINDKEQRLPKMRVIQDMLRGQVQELRRFCNELRPPVLAPFGLEKTIRSHAEGLRELYPGLKITLNLESDGQRLPEEVRMTLFRVYQELINNVLRHSNAGKVDINFRMDTNQVVLEVSDNGIGFELPKNWVDIARGGHLGLVGVQERIQMTGGQVEVESNPGKGTRVVVTVPRPAGLETALAHK